MKESEAKTVTHKPLMDAQLRELLPRLRDAREWGLNATAYAKYYILNEQYWSFYATGFDGKDKFIGLEMSPNGLVLTYFSLAEFESVNNELDLEIIRDEKFANTALREIIDKYERFRKRTPMS